MISSTYSVNLTTTQKTNLTTMKVIHENSFTVLHKQREVTGEGAGLCQRRYHPNITIWPHTDDRPCVGINSKCRICISALGPSQFLLIAQHPEKDAEIQSAHHIISGERKNSLRPMGPENERQIRKAKVGSLAGHDGDDIHRVPVFFGDALQRHYETVEGCRITREHEDFEQRVRG